MTCDARRGVASGITIYSVGERLGDAVVVALEIVAYDEPFTHDILPMSMIAAEHRLPG